MTTRTVAQPADQWTGWCKAAVLIPLIAVTVSLSGCGGENDAVAPPVSDGKASCPQSRDTAWEPADPSRKGELVPAGPTAARLCVYPPPATGTMAQLGRSVDAADPAGVSEYLNSLPEKVPADHSCLLGGRTQYTVVLEYTNGHAVVPVGCGVEYSGAVRPEVDLRTLLGFWNTTLEG